MKSILLIPFLVFAMRCDNTPSEHALPEKKTSSLVPNEQDQNFHDGDIIFQTSHSGQSLAVQLATHSVYSHCGLLFQEKDKWYVYEAVQPVCITPFEEWITHGDSNFYAVKRLGNADSILTEAKIKSMKTYLTSQINKDYDLWFGWTDERMYCSELVWKAYHESTGLEVGQTKKLGDFDLTHPEVKEILAQRYGKKIPKEETVISPGDIFDSPLLLLVKQTKGS
jgi:Permuted papain-like amidase enzyme, YaeF/YiiX, C92 family